jgi:superfamily II DNA/RNA helicase
VTRFHLHEYTDPTPIQAPSIPHVLGGIDLVARAQTGTGKTAAFGLPMIERLVLRGQRTAIPKPLGLVLVPTRELAAQVRDALARYGASVQLRVAAIVGGVSMAPQVKASAHGADVVVATPGRLIDHLQRRTIDLSAIEILVLDAADRMLDMGFLPALRRLHTVTPCVHPVALDRKRDLLVHVLTHAPAGQALVFRRTKRGARSGWPSSRVGRPSGGRDSREQESGLPHSFARGFQSRPRDGSGGHRHRCRRRSSVVTAGFEIAHASRPSSHRGESRLKRSVSI